MKDVASRAGARRRGVIALLTMIAMPAVAGFAVAAEEEPTLPYILPDTVRVESSRLGFRLSDLASSAAVLPPGRIRMSASRETAEILAAVPGLHVYDPSGNGQQGVVESRGFTSFGQTSYLQVLVDGLPIAEIEADRVDWGIVSPEQIERVEVMRGPVASLYGDAAMGGVVNIVTRGPSRGAEGWIETRGGDDDWFRAAAGAAWSGAKSEGSISVVRRSVDGNREHSGARATGGVGTVRFPFSPSTSMRARLIARHSSAEIPGPLPDSLMRSDRSRSLTPEDRVDQDYFQPALELAHRLGASTELTAIARGEIRDLEATESVIPSGAMDRESRTRGAQAEARLRWNPVSSPLRQGLLGASTSMGRLESRYRDPDPSGEGALQGASDVDRATAAAFVAGRFQLSRRLSATGALRVDWTRSEVELPLGEEPAPEAQERSSLSPSIGLSYELPGMGQIFASVARSFKNPTLEQLYDRRPYFVDDDGPGGNPPFILHLSSSALEPQRGTHFDLGTRLSPVRELQIEGSGYYAKSEDEIGFDLANFRYDNIEKSIHYGFEGRATYSPLDPLRAELGYTWTRALFDGGKYDGKQINGVPIHRIHASMRLGPVLGSVLTIDGNHLRDQWLDEGNAYEIDPSTVVDAAIYHTQGALTLFAAMRNLFDEEYASAAYLTIDERGRELPLYFPGAPRSFEIGVRLAAP